MGKTKPLPPVLSKDQMKFWLANTDLTEEDVNQWYKDFRECSKTNDKLDKANFVAFFKKLKYTKSAGDEFTELMFATFDTDKSGYVDFQEFMVTFSILGDGDIEKRLAWVFDLYDINDDGCIERKELENILRVTVLKVKKRKLIGEQTTETKINDIFQKIDQNENNKISLEEFVDACSNSIFLREILCPEVVNK